MISWIPGPMEMVVIAIFGLLVFGKRLPSVARSIGSTFVEFKKGLGGIDEEIKSISQDINKQLPKK